MRVPTASSWARCRSHGAQAPERCGPRRRRSLRGHPWHRRFVRWPWQGHHCPSQRGQIQAIARAYNQAGYAPSSVELVEAHGTSTKVGDATELSTLGTLWTDIEAGDNVAVGSIKSQIGHLKAAAGMAGLLKVTMALHHATIPPSAGLKHRTQRWTGRPIPSLCPRSPWLGLNLRAIRAVLASAPSVLAAPTSTSPSRPTTPRFTRPWARRGRPVGTPTLARLRRRSGVHPRRHRYTFAGPCGPQVRRRWRPAALWRQRRSRRGSPRGTQRRRSDLRRGPAGHRLSAVFPTWSTGFDVNAAVRLAVVATSWAEFEKRKGLAASSLSDPARWGFLAAQGVMVTDQPAMPPKPKSPTCTPVKAANTLG